MNYNKYYKKIHCVEDEEIVSVIHAHWIAKLQTFLIAFLFFAVPLFFMFYLMSQGRVGVSIFVTSIVVGLIYSLREWYLWTYNVFIITTHKIIDLEQRSLLKRSVSEVSYDKIVDVSYEHEGLLDTMFGMGKITVVTNIPNTTLQITHVGNVATIAGVLIEVVKKQGVKKPQGPNRAQRQEVVEDFLGGEVEALGEQSLDEVVQNYLAVYSKDRLKRLLQKDLERNGHKEVEQ
ncbi:PH domain-containing protein [Candidatus Falkowbacteria bacterium]|nr:PH domain-containing protein [Candidatus Falkowbacteria bacterium]